MISKNSVWKFPWGYTEGLFIAVGLLTAGIAIQLATGSYIPLPSKPFNLLTLSLIFLLTRSMLTVSVLQI